MTKFALLLPLFAVACTESQARNVPAEHATVKPELAIATEMATPEVVSLTGKVVADQRAELTADTQGRVVEVLVERGQRVKRGEPILRLDTQSAALTTQEAAARLLAARTDQQLAAIECERSKKLYAVGAISRSELDRQGAQCASSQQNVSAAAARTAYLAKAVKDGIVRAPFDGIVSERGVNAGEWVAPGRSLVTLVDADPLKLEISVPEVNVAAIALDQHVTISTVAHANVAYDATITRISAEIGKTRSLIVEATIAPGSKLVPGMFVQAEVITGQTRLPSVPQTAVVKRGKVWHAFVITNSKIEERIVQLGASPGTGMVSILQNINAGERVVAHVTEQITDGLRVEE
jgi:membrane fusion protein (multidrug efflux system)